MEHLRAKHGSGFRAVSVFFSARGRNHSDLQPGRYVLSMLDVHINACGPIEYC